MFKRIFVRICLPLLASFPFFIGLEVTAQPTNLVTGDVAFTAYNSDATASDTFGIMLLENINSGTQIVFTDGQYTDASGAFDFHATAFTDWVLIWQASSNMTAGTQIKFWSSPLNCNPCSAGSSHGTIAGGRGFVIPPSGDQIFACQGGTFDTTTAPKKYTPGTVLAGIHANYISGTTTDANWDNGAGTSTSNSELPNSLTNGVNCLRIGVTDEYDNLRYNCSVLTGTKAAIRTAINTVTNWDVDDDNPFSPAICSPPVSAPTVTTWDGTTWDNGTPSATIDAIIASSVTPGSFTCKDLTINSNYSLTVNSGTTATIHGDVTNSGNGIAGTGVIVFAKSGNASLGGNALSVSGTIQVNTGTVLVTNNKLTLKSDATSTGRIATGDANGGYLSGNVTVERFLPAKTVRKYSFLAAPITANISSSWQQQIHITGTGTGGVACSNALTTSQPTPHSNGFDATVTNASSMFYYDQSSVSSKWIAISGTNSVSITPGTGYRVNVRGPRSLGCSLLGTSNPPIPPAVTLSTTGTLTTGNLPIAVAGASGENAYTLLGNPYACELDFAAFRSDISNSGNISNSYWTYDPQRGLGSNTYSTYNNGIGTNFPGGYGNTGIIASGQAFFVEKTTPGSGTVTFKEAHKSTTAQTGLFKTTNINDIIRVALKYNDSSHADEVVVRFNQNGSHTYNSEWDAVSLNGGTRITTQKHGKTLAIQTRPELFSNDTVDLSVYVGSSGNYLLNFNDNAQLNGSAVLWDKYNNSFTAISPNTFYPFTVTTDTLTQGGRFTLLFTPGNVLNIDAIRLNANVKPDHVQLSWQSVSDELVSYEVQRSSDGMTFQNLMEVPKKSDKTYTVLDKEPLTYNYYRIKGISGGGNYVYSNIVAAGLGGVTAHITVQPNPVYGKKLMLSFWSVPGGSYMISLYNAVGRKLGDWHINHEESNEAVTLLLPEHATSGMYLLSVQGGSNFQHAETIIINQ